MRQHPTCLNCGGAFGTHDPDDLAGCGEWHPSTMNEPSEVDANAGTDPKWRPCVGGDVCPSRRRGVLGWLPHDHYVPPTTVEVARR